MKLSEYIEKLQELQEKYNRDLEVIYSVDDEGNYFSKVKYNPSECNYIDDDVSFLNQEPGIYVNAVCIN